MYCVLAINSVTSTVSAETRNITMFGRMHGSRGKIFYKNETTVKEKLLHYDKCLM